MHLESYTPEVPCPLPHNSAPPWTKAGSPQYHGHQCYHSRKRRINNAVNSKAKPHPSSHQGPTLTTNGIDLIKDDDVKRTVDAKLLLIHLRLSKQIPKCTALQ